MPVTVGVPAVVMVNVPGEPGKNVALLALVIAGASVTTMLNDCVAFGVTPLLAVMVIGDTPPTDGVPEIVAVPSPLFRNVMPAGNAPVSVIVVTGGTPVVVTV